MLDAIAADQNQPARLVDLIIFVDSQTRAAPATHPSADRLDDHNDENDHRKNHSRGNEVVSVLAEQVHCRDLRGNWRWLRTIVARALSCNRARQTDATDGIYCR